MRSPAWLRAFAALCGMTWLASCGRVGVELLEGDDSSTVDESPLCPDGPDADRDGVPDACDVCARDPRDDADGDGRCADVDNCPLVANADQRDTDGDGEGDACERAPDVDPEPEPDPDADGDGAADGRYAYPPSNFDPAPVYTARASALVLSCGRTTFDTQTLTFGNACGQQTPIALVQTQTQQGGPEIAILPLSSLTIATGSTLAVTGSRPLVLAVLGDAAVLGTIDASASGATAGSGGNALCGLSAGIAGGGLAPLGGGGGGGGGFATNGGAGGGGGFLLNGGTHGQARGAESVSPLLGGCGGGTGGGCSTTGGAGGGAVQISATGLLDVRGALRANGGRGSDGCATEGGGAGGGSGGALLLEASHLAIASGVSLTADGGAGGHGHAFGIGGSGMGGAGGSSAALPSNGGLGFSNGGGGGGGALGRIRLRGFARCSIAGTSSATASIACP